MSSLAENELWDAELEAAAFALRWYAEKIEAALPRMPWRQHHTMRCIAQGMKAEALEIELPVLVRKRWAFLNITRH